MTDFLVEFAGGGTCETDELCDVCVKHRIGPWGFTPNKAKYQVFRRAESGDDVDYTYSCTEHMDMLLSNWDMYGIGERKDDAH